MNKIILLIVATVLLTGCAVGEKKIKIFSKVEEPKTKLDYPRPFHYKWKKLNGFIHLKMQMKYLRS